MPDRAGHRIDYIEGLRGIAAMQVLLLHFVTGFLPHTAEHAWPPLRLLFDGHTAVYVFFLISGAVLTPSFARPGGVAGKLARRIVRLGVPVAATAAIALGLLLLFPEAHRRAAALTGSAWLAMDSNGALTGAHLAREIGLDSLLLGYREATLFAPLAPRLPLMEHSLDAPFWSLHLELYGSILVLALVWLRANARWPYRGAVLAAAIAFGAHPMFLFVLGHLSAPLLARVGGEGLWRGVRTLCGAALLAFGIALCINKSWPGVEAFRLWLSMREWAFAPNLFQFQSQFGAIMLYFGVLLCVPTWRLLGSEPCRRLGRLSFSVYLLHFPILFTLVCAGFIRLSAYLPHTAAIAAAFVLFLALTFAAAMLFERCVDRPAIALSRGAGFGRLRAA